MDLQEMQIVAETILGPKGTSLAGSSNIHDPAKIKYLGEHLGDLVVFSSGIITISGMIWNGDINISQSLKQLKKIARDINKRLYVLYSTDIEKLHKNEEILLSSSAIIINPDGAVEMTNREVSGYFSISNDAVQLKEAYL